MKKEENSLCPHTDMHEIIVSNPLEVILRVLRLFLDIKEKSRLLKTLKQSYV
jgi:hypothetical protein